MADVGKVRVDAPRGAAPAAQPADRPTDLALIEGLLWREMDHAARSRAHAWRRPVLATVAADPDAADARVVVLRAVQPGSSELVFFTDARSPKVAQLVAAPLGTLVMWSPVLNWQLRLRVALRLETTGLAVSSHWARLQLTPAAQDYLSAWPPGAALPVPVAGFDTDAETDADTEVDADAKTDAEVDDVSIDDADLSDDAQPASPPSPAWSTRNHFALIMAQVLRMDWLELHPDGHRRAVFGDGAPRWVQA